MKLFIDTNIPLHHQSLDHIDWKSLTGTDEVCLVVSVVVFDELDQHTRNARLAGRARTVRAQLNKFVDSGIVKGTVKAEAILRPHQKVLESYEMDPSQNDQWILATIKDYLKNHSEATVALLTADVGMRIKAKAHGIAVIMIDEKYALTDENDEQKENRKLKAELEKLKSAIPQLSIAFEKGKIDSFELESPDYEKYVRAELWDMQYRRYPKISSHVGDQQAAIYNSQLNQYYQAYEGYLRSRRELYLAETLTLKLNLHLKNAGSVLAKNIDIELLFPPGMTISEETVKSRLPEPNRLHPPIYGELKPLRWTHETNYNPYPRPEPESKLRVRKVAVGTMVEFHVASVKQQKDLSIPPVYVTLDPDSEIRGFNVEYSIRAENVPDVVRGTLNVNVTPKKEEPTKAKE